MKKQPSAGAAARAYLTRDYWTFLPRLTEKNTADRWIKASEKLFLSLNGEENGLLVAYCSRFDVWVNSPRKIYLVFCCIAYLCGMVLTFAVMLVTKMGQPALLYLVPFTLLVSALLAWRRGEMRQFWNGTTYEMEHLTIAEEESADYS